MRRLGGENEVFGEIDDIEIDLSSLSLYGHVDQRFRV